MILIEIRDYIIQHKEVTLPQLAMHFQMPESAIENMVEMWVHKKTVEKLTLTCGSLSDASGCQSCSGGCATQVIQEFNRNRQILYRPI